MAKIEFHELKEEKALLSEKLRRDFLGEVAIEFQ